MSPSFRVSKPTDLMTRAEFYMELRSTWERMIDMCGRGMRTPTKAILLHDAEAAIRALSMAYDVDDLVDLDHLLKLRSNATRATKNRRISSDT